MRAFAQDAIGISDIDSIAIITVAAKVCRIALIKIQLQDLIAALSIELLDVLFIQQAAIYV